MSGRGSFPCPSYRCCPMAHVSLHLFPAHCLLGQASDPSLCLWRCSPRKRRKRARLLTTTRRLRISRQGAGMRYCLLTGFHNGELEPLWLRAPNCMLLLGRPYKARIDTNSKNTQVATGNLLNTVKGSPRPPTWLGTLALSHLAGHPGYIILFAGSGLNDPISWSYLWLGTLAIYTSSVGRYLENKHCTQACIRG